MKNVIDFVIVIVIVIVIVGGMGSCLSGASSAPSFPLNTNHYYYENYKYSRASNMELRLHRISRRLFLNGSTPVASLFCKQGRKGINQDAMLLWENFGSMEDSVLCGVFDGHGPFGHVLAKKVRDSLPLKLMDEWNVSGDHDYGTLKESFLKASKSMDRELSLHHRKHAYSSGTTAVTLLKKGDELVISNVGDSRAVLGTKDPNGSLIALQLTTDLKPNLPREAERIRLCKGRVFAHDKDSGVARVWLPNVDSPGLAMARAFGDFCLKDFGLISIPDVSHHRLSEQDQFVVLATDGVWDVLSNKQVVDIVASTPRSSAAKVLVESAVQAWRTKHPTSNPDDCSAVCLFFHSHTNTTPDTNIVGGEKGTKQKHQ